MTPTLKQLANPTFIKMARKQRSLMQAKCDWYSCEIELYDALVAKYPNVNPYDLSVAVGALAEQLGDYF